MSGDGDKPTVYGIDLGTTYSCIARVDEYGRPEILRNVDAGPTTPSVVLFDTQQNVEGDRACGRDGHKKDIGITVGAAESGR